MGNKALRFTKSPSPPFSSSSTIQGNADDLLVQKQGNDAAYTLEALIGLCFKSLEKETAGKDMGDKSN